MRTRRERQTKRGTGLRTFSLSQAMFVLPNLFTVASIFCSFHAMILAAGGGYMQIHRAALAIFFAIFFDMADGRVARLTRTQSDFGVQLDSLADVVSFGVAPAFILHRFCLGRMGAAGSFVAFAYVACGSIRLARFNVLAARGEKLGTSYFTGLPIPVAAGTLMAWVLYSGRGFEAAVSRGPRGLWICVGLLVLMVSNVRYRTFKETQASPKIVGIGLLLLGIFAALAFTYEPSFALVVYAFAYVLSGLMETSRDRWLSRNSEDSAPQSPQADA